MVGSGKAPPREGRSEDDKVAQASIVLVFGGKDYPIKPLVIRESREWRAKIAKLIGSLPQYTSITTDTPGEFNEAIGAMLVAMPDSIVDLVFQYAKALDRDEIEGLATDAEMALAFEQIIEVAFPLARSMVGAMAKLSQ